MKAISLWQPWASAVALGSKEIETRSWATNYCGFILIHAAKRKPTLSECENYATAPHWKAALHGKHPNDLPYGAIVAFAQLDACLPVEEIAGGALDHVWGRSGLHGAWTERSMGDFSLGRYGWCFSQIQAFAKPIPYRGAQGLFNVPDSIIDDAELIDCARH